MRKVISFFLILCIVTMPYTAFTTDMGEYMKNVLDQMGSLTPHAYKGQERGYFIGGQMSVRVPQDTIQPFSFTPPSFHAGCSGIDLVLGGFSYLNVDALVSKLQAILQAAPFLAFDIALQTLCQPCSAAMKAAESFSDFINQLNVNSCQAAQALVGWSVSELKKKIYGDVAAKKTQKGESSSFFKALTDNLNNASDTVKKWKESFKTWITQNGIKYQDLVTKAYDTKKDQSFIKFVVEELGYKPFKNFEGWLRYMVGDVICHYKGDETPPHCSRDDPFIVKDDSIEKEIGGVVKDGVYYTVDVNHNTPVPQKMANTVVDEVLTILSNFDLASRSGGLSPQQINLINASPIPVLPFWKLCYIMDDPDFTNATLDEISLPIAYGVFYQTLRRIHVAIVQALNGYKRLSSATYPEPYRTDLIKSLEILAERLNKLTAAAARAYDKELKKAQVEYNSFLDAYKQKQAEVARALKRVKMYDSYTFQSYVDRMSKGGI